MSEETEPAQVSDKKPEPVSPRPHRITILLGLVSPSLSIAAVVISLLGLYTSRQSLEIGQRAYLGISKLEASFAKDSKNDTDNAILALAFDIANSGNTPAELTAVKIRIKHMDGPNSGKEDDSVDSAGVTIGKGTAVNRAGYFRVSRRTQDAWAVRAVFEYTDVFEASHSFQWCATVLDNNENNILNYRRSDCKLLHFSAKP